MSRIGRKAIQLPTAVTLIVTDKIRVTGPKGELSLQTHPNISVQPDGDMLVVTRKNDAHATRALHGLYRALIQNMIDGVVNGYEIRLEMKGVGYRATKQGNDLVLNLGFSHPITVTAPAGIELATEKTSIFVRGIDKQQVGEMAAGIRRLRPPEPYKGKGIRYTDEVIRMKAGKAAKAAGK